MALNMAGVVVAYWAGVVMNHFAEIIEFERQTVSGQKGQTVTVHYMVSWHGLYRL